MAADVGRHRRPVSMSSLNRCLLVIGLLAGGGCEVDPQAEMERVEEFLGADSVTALADIGAGDGDHLTGWSRLVGADGIVFATEIDPALVVRLKERIAAESLHNVVVREATATSTGLPERCCDVIVLRHVYHHLTNPSATLRDIEKALKPGGRLLVIDFTPVWMLAPWTPDELPDDRTGHGVTPDIIVREATDAGLESVQVAEEWPGDSLLMNRFAVLLLKTE